MKMSLGIVVGPIALALALIVLLDAGSAWLPGRGLPAGVLGADILHRIIEWFPWVFVAALLAVGVIAAATKGFR